MLLPLLEAAPAVALDFVAAVVVVDANYLLFPMVLLLLLTMPAAAVIFVVVGSHLISFCIAIIQHEHRLFAKRGQTAVACA